MFGGSSVLREGLILPIPKAFPFPFPSPTFLCGLGPALFKGTQAFTYDLWVPPGGHDWQSFVGVSTGLKQLSTALDPEDTARINQTGDPSLQGASRQTRDTGNVEQRTTVAGTSWRGWGKLRFELSCVRKEAAERRVRKAEGLASSRAPRWRQT